MNLSRLCILVASFLALAFLPFLLKAGPASHAPEAAKLKVVSHPPLRQAVPFANQPLGQGPAFFVDAQQGKDTNAGTQDAPWRTIQHALGQLKAGDTLYLRGGIYYENVAVRLQGREDAPITIRSYPNEQAIIDGGLREFLEAPAKAWEPYPQGGPGEFRSKQRYPNLRDVVGRFGDSLIGLHTYYHAKDLRATNEWWDWEDPSHPDKTDIKPLWCGPGLWYDAATGYIHMRLAPTHLPERANYTGETDPRQLPLLLAPYRSVPLQLDGAKHIRVQDLIIRSGGYDTVVLQQCVGIEFSNVTVWCGTYGLRAVGTQKLKLVRSAFYGSVPPWCYRQDTSLRSRPGRPYRDITRLSTHALVVPDAGREYSVYAYPLNDDWEIAWCNFTDGHDGLYLGAINLHFHHNRLLDFQDDGIYLSPMYVRIGGSKAVLRLEQNYFGKCLTALAFGGPEGTQDTVYLCRNIFDLRGGVPTARPSAKNPQGGLTGGKPIGDHGSPPWSTLYIYHNTFIATGARFGDMALLGAAAPERPRRLFNNILLHPQTLPPLNMPAAEYAHEDGNLYWQPGLDVKKAAAFFDKFRKSPAYANSKKVYPPGFTTNSLVADPKFRKADDELGTANDYRLQSDSPAVDRGVDIPAEWPDPLRILDKGKPDIGALPLGAEPFRAGAGR